MFLYIVFILGVRLFKERRAKKTSEQQWTIVFFTTEYKVKFMGQD